MERVIVLTNHLIDYLDRLKLVFDTTNDVEQSQAYFDYVKNETTPIFTVLEEWSKRALQAVKKGNIKVYPQQIESTKENMQALIMHSYYVDVRKRRYMDIHRSCYYVYSTLVKELKEDGTK